MQALLLVLVAPNAFAKPPRTLITVVTADWSATTGELRRWARDGGSWRAVGAAVPVVVGKSGLKWPKDKREGDGAAPAGRMPLGVATGYSSDAPAGTTLEYHVATEHTRCVDDPTSMEYNRVVDDRCCDCEPRGECWHSAEAMRRDDELYRYAIFVRHNDARVPGKGSCIFLHVWRDARSPTVGCTAMALDDLRALLAWATPSTVLVQLPRAEYDAHQREWDLPHRK